MKNKIIKFLKYGKLNPIQCFLIILVSLTFAERHGFDIYSSLGLTAFILFLGYVFNVKEYLINKN